MERVLGKCSRKYWMGISIFAVIMLHIVYERQTSDLFFKFLKMTFLQGDMGVNIFFFLSSYGLCCSFDGHSLSRFYWNRIKRVYPVYLVFIFGIMVWRMQYKGCAFEITYILERLSGCNVLRHEPFLEGDAWYMSALIILYVTFPLLYKGVNILAKIGWQWIYMLVVLITILYYIPITGTVMAGAFHARLHIILLGMSTYFLKMEKDLLKLYVGTACLSLLTYNDCSFYFYIPLILYGVDKTNLKMPMFSLFSFLGEHSLELYLAQVFGLQVLFLHLHNNYYLDVFVCLLVTAILSFIFYMIQSVFLQLVNKIVK